VQQRDVGVAREVLHVGRERAERLGRRAVAPQLGGPSGGIDVDAQRVRGGTDDRGGLPGGHEDESRERRRSAGEAVIERIG